MKLIKKNQPKTDKPSGTSFFRKIYCWSLQILHYLYFQTIKTVILLLQDFLKIREDLQREEAQKITLTQGKKETSS